MDAVECSSMQCEQFRRKRTASPGSESQSIHQIKRPCGFEYYWPAMDNSRLENMSNQQVELGRFKNSTPDLGLSSSDVDMDCSKMNETKRTHTANGILSCNNQDTYVQLYGPAYQRAHSPGNQIDPPPSLTSTGHTLQLIVECARCCAGEPGHIRHIMS